MLPMQLHVATMLAATKAAALALRCLHLHPHGCTLSHCGGRYQCWMCMCTATPKAVGSWVGLWPSNCVCNQAAVVPLLLFLSLLLLALLLL